MIRRVGPLFFFLITAPLVHSQTLYTYGFFNESSTIQVERINLSTGALTPVATTDAIAETEVQAQLDPVGHRLFFNGTLPNGASAMYTANVQTGSFSKLPSSFGQLEFDVGTSTLYTYGFFNGGTSAQIFSINLSTGSLSSAVTTDAIGVALEDAAFDPIGHRLFFNATAPNGANTLYTANVQTGSFSKLSGAFGPLGFDVSTGTLYTYGFFNGGSSVQVFSINLSTGALTPVITTDAVGFVFVDAAFDPAGHRLFFVATTPGGANALYTANVQTGSFSKLLGPFGQLEFDPTVTGVPSTPIPSTLGLLTIGLVALIVVHTWNRRRGQTPRKMDAI
jgi:hypothetical protein